MTFRSSASAIGMTVLFAACGGGSQSPLAFSASTRTAMVSVIADAPINTRSSAIRPQYISASTANGYVAINGATPQALSCTVTVCTGSFAVPVGSTTFTAELDTGNNAPAESVLAEGSQTQTIAPGSNSVTITMNGVASRASFDPISYDAITGSLSSIAVADAAGSNITNAPSAGATFDNGAPVYVVNSAAATAACVGFGGCTGAASVTPTAVTIDSLGNDYATVITCSGTGNVAVNLQTAHTSSPEFTIPNSGAGSGLVYPAIDTALSGSGAAAILSCGATGHPTSLLGTGAI